MEILLKTPFSFYPVIFDFFVCVSLDLIHFSYLFTKY